MSAEPLYSGGWSWDDIEDETLATEQGPDHKHPEETKEKASPPQRPVQEETPSGENTEEQQLDDQQGQQRHYPPRTCRICLEEVYPTFEPVTEGITSMFNPAPRVTYISSDPASGRLIRPCKCRGSQKYVHEGCLQEWRHADPSYGRRTYYECPTCKFQYRLERIKWSKWLTSATLQIMLTIFIMLTAIFIFGFIADPIINLYMDPFDTITTTATGGKMPAITLDDEDAATWSEHFMKGLASLGLLGFLKVSLTVFPWNLRRGIVIGGGGGRRGGRQGGRERMQDLSWAVIVIGFLTFLVAVWTWVRAWSLRTLEKAGEKVADVQGDDDDEENEPPPSTETAS